MPLTKDDIQGLLTETEARLQSAIKMEVEGAEKRLDKRLKDTEAHLDKKIDGVEHRLNERIEGVEKRLEQKIDSQRQTLQIFIDQQLRKTNGLIADVAEQLKLTHHAVTYALEKQADLDARVENLEQRVAPPL